MLRAGLRQRGMGHRLLSRTYAPDRGASGWSRRSDNKPKDPIQPNKNGAKACAARMVNSFECKRLFSTVTLVSSSFREEMF